MQIKIFTNSHIEKVLEIENQLFSVPWTRFDFEMLLEDFSFNFVLEDNDKIVGYLCSMLEAKNLVHLLNFAIAKDYQRKGWGEKFLYFFIYVYLKPRKLNKIYLEVRESNKPAISIYKKFGFVIVDTKRNYYQKPVEDALIMYVET